MDQIMSRIQPEAVQIICKFYSVTDKCSFWSTLVNKINADIVTFVGSVF